jgi:hypothetical protein
MQQEDKNSLKSIDDVFAAYRTTQHQAGRKRYRKGNTVTTVAG